ncbi:preprotein translocase subunit SecE [Campylobacter troglodytis]|uniref:preprotein translocase subunit SecE n=1 Tax=Campylobacter troglodytis TaxID=654363 RepID=UPI0011575C8C|nr:preprotein translocase subunit SecE [Campylobacter troglodytis]TQR61318.1 preprotein translocase subunit SecE [Campylobacter troglodytis]
MKNLIAYVKLSKAELSKVIFPMKEQVRNAYITVFVVVTVVALFLALVDWIMSSSISLVVR